MITLVNWLKYLKKMDKNKISFLLCSIVSVYLTWMMNHKLSLNPVLANGIVGFLAAVLLPKNLAGVAYTSSFVGMSSSVVLPNLAAVLLSGTIVGLVIIFTSKAYAGIGGKGGTTAAASTIMTKIIMGIMGWL